VGGCVYKFVVLESLSGLLIHWFPFPLDSLRSCRF
jgi:hypothetical protein